MKNPKCPDCKAEMVQIPARLKDVDIVFFAYACPNSEIFQFAVKHSTFKDDVKKELLKGTKKHYD